MQIVAQYGGQSIPQNPIFFEKRKKTIQTQKCLELCQNQRYAHRDAWFPPCLVRQNQPKNYFFCWAILDHFQTKMFKYETNCFH